MKDEIERQLINAELNKIKQYKKRIFRITKNRDENRETLLQLGYTDSIVEEIILELQTDDCISSFEKDKAGLKGYVFEFGKVINGKEVYIKFRVLFEKDICHINCISFHFAKYRMEYKFK
ncbi:MAG: type II toxin-antitoxin system MqsR family toxin [Candidatus Goldbacteria bacterium]|nr:type II toxin-antitoxin system MqsR family toxin [Candidatus Goldiibacteriota bacterium]